MNDTMPIGPTQASQLYAELNAAHRRIRELEDEKNHLVSTLVDEINRNNGIRELEKREAVLREALEWIAQETGTPYATRATAALIAAIPSNPSSSS